MNNPFPGLRPFQIEESHLFFGREEQTGQLLERLGNTRFLAVVGASGSGKSSLVRAGLLPQLYGGTMVKTSVNWEIAIMRPGGNPITNLARCLVDADIYEDNSEDQVQLLRTILSRSGLGLLEAYRHSDIEQGSNMLILVDQFEEIGNLLGKFSLDEYLPYDLRIEAQIRSSGSFDDLSQLWEFLVFVGKWH